MNNDSYIKGRNAILEALESNVGVEKVFIQSKIKNDKLEKIISRCKEKKIPFYFKEKFYLDNITDFHQGVIAQVSNISTLSLEDLSDGPVVVLDGLTDTHNVGAIIRSAVAFGIKNIVLRTRNSAPINDTVAKESAGAIYKARIARVSNINYALEYFKENGYWVYGSSLRANEKIQDMQFDRKSVIIIGSESKGMSVQVEKNCDFKFYIDASGFESLNASVAAGIIFYEFSRNLK